MVSPTDGRTVTSILHIAHTVDTSSLAPRYYHVSDSGLHFSSQDNLFIAFNAMSETDNVNNKWNLHYEGKLRFMKIDTNFEEEWFIELAHKYGRSAVITSRPGPSLM